jgi:hypothetical protein
LNIAGGISHEKRTRISSTLNPVHRGLNDLNDLLMLILPDATYQNQYIKAEVAGAIKTGPFSHELLIGISDEPSIASSR